MGREWEAEQQKKKEQELNGVSDSEDEEVDEDEDLPFACLICRQEFKKPIVTKYILITKMIISFLDVVIIFVRHVP